MPRSAPRSPGGVLALATAVFLSASIAYADEPAVGSQPPAETASPTPIRVVLQWLPQSQFAGFYVALENGLYREAGLDITLLHAGPGPSSLDFLIDGRADFATLFLADAVVANDPAGSLVQAGQFFQTSSLLLAGWKELGVLTPSDLDGRPVSYWQSAFSVAFNAFFEQQGIRPVPMPQHHSVNLFLRRGVVACAAMYYNEYHRIHQAGVDYDEMTVFLMRDYGLGFPEDGIYTTAERFAASPETARALRDATLAGWRHAQLHPEEAVDLVLRESRLAGVPANRPHSRWMLDHVLASIYPPNVDLVPGRLGHRAYEETVQALRQAGLIQTAPSFEAFAPLEADTP